MTKLDRVNQALSKATSTLKLGKPPSLRAGAIVCVQTHHYSAYEDLLTALRSFTGKGWVTYTDEVCELSPDHLDSNRWALNGEWCNEQQSLILRRDQRGWSTWILETQDSDDEWISETSHLKIPRGRLIYEVSWGLTEDGARYPKASRLVRIEQES